MGPLDRAHPWFLHLCPADSEDVTRKTGNFKRFNVFVKMLVSALENSSDSVYLDLLTYADLVRPLSRFFAPPPPTTAPLRPRSGSKTRIRQ